MTFEYPPSLSLACTPTPIQKLHHLTEAWGGPEIYIKRDDLTGCVLSGNKIRKLEFSAAEALGKGADTLVTCGGLQSNHARATALVAAGLGMRSLLVLRGSGDPPWDGNYLLDRLAGAEFEFITPEEYRDVDALMAAAAERLRKEGRTPYLIPEGASNEIGYFGYVKASEEINRQLHDEKLEIDFIVAATGSGGTLGGLVLGRRFFDMKPEPVGINVCDTAGYFQARILGVLQSMVSRYGWDLEIASEEIRLIDGYVGEGYALSRPEELQLIAEVARLEGIVLDPVYGGKAMFGLKDRIRRGRFEKGQRILFIHTGGVFGLFPQRDAFQGAVNGTKPRDGAQDA